MSFQYDGNKGHHQYILSISEDYPENTVLSRQDVPENMQILSDRIPVIFQNLSKELYREVLIPFQDGEMETSSSSRTGSQSSIYEDCRSQEDEEDYNSDYDDYEDYYDEEDMPSEEEDININTLLSQDMENIRLQYGASSISHRLFGAIDDIDVELHIDMSFLDREIARAWKVIREEPITVRLHLSVSRYLDATEPKVEVFQPSQKEKFGVGSQLRKVLETFIANEWKSISNDVVESKYVKVTKRKLNGSPPKKKLQTQLSNTETASKPAEAAPVPHVIDDHSLARLIDMGFSVDRARNALIIARGAEEEAVNLLINNQDKAAVSNKNAISSLVGDILGRNKSSSSEMSSATGRMVKHLAKRQHSYPKGAKDSRRAKHLLLRQNSGAMASTSHGACSSAAYDPASPPASPLEDLNLLPSSTKSGKNAKQVPDLESGFLAQVMQYTRQRLPTLNEYCVVCDESHVFQNGAMLKPAVCARELCVFAFQTLGVMSDAAEDIATGAEVVDLLIVMATSACKSSRRETILDPFPTVIDPNNPTELALHPKKKDFERVEGCLDQFPRMNQMTSLVGSELKGDMDKRDHLAYPLLQWIISSNRSHIVKLPPEKQISFMHTSHQFLLLSSPPAKEAIFRAAKQQYGSTFAFHGSHIENWHSILRVGLINASGTKYQMHGAAYGSGIYLSPHASVSFSYSGMGYGHHKARANPRTQTAQGGRFVKSKNLTCIALCEVINKDLKKSNGQIWVMPNPDYVCTRFFFVYEDGQVGDSNIDTTVEKYSKEILKAVNYQMG